jgi:Holliday junction resolvasome RuvABC endonuclease subunit
MQEKLHAYHDALILDLIRAEAMEGRVYTEASFAKKFAGFQPKDYDWPKDETWQHQELATSVFCAQTMLALDLGTTTGWAMVGPEFPITSGTVSFKNSRFEGGGMRFLKFTRFLDEIHHLTKINQVYFEEVRRHLGVDAAHAYGGFLAHLTAWCEQNKIPYQGVPVGTIKKHATGKGNANKKLMIESVKARGHTPADDNEADAIALLYWAMKN